MSMYGVGGSAAGGVNRAFAQMSIVTRQIQDSLSRMERPYKAVMDDVDAHDNAATLRGNTSTDRATVNGNLTHLSNLDADYEMLNGVGDMLSEMAQLASRKTAGEDVGQQITELNDTIEALLDGTTSAGTAYTLGTDGAGTNTVEETDGGLALTSSSTQAQITAAMDTVNGWSMSVRSTRDAIALTNKSLGQRMDSNSSSQQDLLATDDSTFAAQVTYLQSRQSAVAASVGIQNAVAANSIINIFG